MFNSRFNYELKWMHIWLLLCLFFFFACTSEFGYKSVQTEVGMQEVTHAVTRHVLHCEMDQLSKQSLSTQ